MTQLLWQIIAKYWPSSNHYQNSIVHSKCQTFLHTLLGSRITGNKIIQKRSIRLLSQMELRFFLKEIIQQDSNNHSEAVIDELIKCYHLCKTHFIDIASMSSFFSSPSTLLVKWIYELEKIKLARRLY